MAVKPLKLEQLVQSPWITFTLFSPPTWKILLFLGVFYSLHFSSLPALAHCHIFSGHVSDINRVSKSRYKQASFEKCLVWSPLVLFWRGNIHSVTSSDTSRLINQFLIFFHLSEIKHMERRIPTLSTHLSKDPKVSQNHFLNWKTIFGDLLYLSQQTGFQVQNFLPAL